MEEGHPLRLLCANVRAVLEREPAMQECMCVLLSTGSYNPIHRSHLRMFDIARRHLEGECGLRVVAGFASPSHDEYVQRKLRPGVSLSGDVRVQLGNRALEEEPSLHSLRSWVCMDPWECSQDHFADFPEVLQSLVDQCREESELEGVARSLRFLYLCGEDHCSVCNLWGDRNVVCIARTHKGHSSRHSTPPVNRKCIYIEDEGCTTDHSSTLVRERLQAGQRCEHITFPSIVRALKSMGYGGSHEDTEEEVHAMLDCAKAGDLHSAVWGHQADVNAFPGSRTFAMVHHCACVGDTESMRALRDLGADFTLLTREPIPRSAAQVAEDYGFSELAILLRQWMAEDEALRQ